MMGSSESKKIPEDLNSLGSSFRPLEDELEVVGTLGRGGGTGKYCEWPF
jgi:hypothetical protein